MEPAPTHLGIRWLVLVVSYFLVFIVLFGVFLVHVDLPFILQGGVVFSLFVGTVGSVIMWWRNEDQPTYGNLAISSGLAVTAFVAFLVLRDGTAKDFWTPSVLILFFIGIIVGLLTKRVYQSLMKRMGRFSTT